MSNAITTMDDNSQDYLAGALEYRVAGLLDGVNRIVSSMPNQSEDEQAAMFAAMTTSQPLKENLKKPFNLAHVIVEVVEINDAATGEQVSAPRVILVTDAGESYHATSAGVLASLERLFTVFGKPNTWQKPKRVQAETVKTRRGDAMILNAAK